jgi:acetyl/propionyl-CoA carboxylase alpha subunit
MQRALDEYEVRGIRTTIPFFRWILREAAFAEGRFHTSYLDEVLQQRQGTPFLTSEASLEEVAAVALAVLRVRPERKEDWTSAPAEPVPSGWKQAARIEGLRS